MIGFPCSAWGIPPQVILQTLLIKAEEKLQNGEKIIKEHENIDSTMAVSETVKVHIQSKQSNLTAA